MLTQQLVRELNGCKARQHNSCRSHCSVYAATWTATPPKHNHELRYICRHLNHIKKHVKMLIEAKCRSTYLDHLNPVALQPGALSIPGSVSVDAAHHTGDGGGGPVEAHGVGHISPNDHEGVVLMGEQLGSVANLRQQAVLTTQLSVDLQHQVAAVLLALTWVGREAVIYNNQELVEILRLTMVILACCANVSERLTMVFQACHCQGQ